MTQSLKWRRPNVEQLKKMRSSSLFNALTDDQLEQLKSDIHYHPLNSGETLFTQGKAAQCFYFVDNGQIKLFRLSKEGQEKVFGIFSSQKTFAEALIFAKQPSYPVTAEAVVNSGVISINAEAYLQILRDSTEACFGIMADMSQKLHAKINEIDQLTLHDATYRLACWLLSQVPQLHTGAPNLSLKTPKNVIASQLSIKPETFSRSLKRLQKRGLIEVSGNQIVISEFEQLQNLVTAETL